MPDETHRRRHNVPEEQDMAKDEIRLVLGRLKNGERAHYSLKAADQYPATSLETEIWRLVDAVFKERMKALG